MTQVSQESEDVVRGHAPHAPPAAEPKPDPRTFYKPKGDRILLRPESPPEQIGLIILAAATRSALAKQVDRGEVLAMGPGMLTVKGERWPMPDVAVGETLIFFIEGGVQVQVGEETLLSIRDDFAIGVVEADGSLRPLGTRFAVRQSKAEESSAGGIFIPHAVRNPPLEGTVVAVGRGQKRLRSGLAWHTAPHEGECAGRDLIEQPNSRTTVECSHAAHFAPEETALCWRKLGEVVLFGAGLGIPIEFDGEKLRILSEGDLHAVRE